MGLDMYLEARHYVQRWDHIPAGRQFAVSVTRGGEPYTPIDPKRVSYVIEQVAYWRKANQVHRWFVEHVQGGEDDCEAYPVSRTQLAELLSLVEQVLASHTQAEALLPTEPGFFFGDTGYGEWYFYDLEETRRQLVPILALEDDNAEYYYRASW